MVAGGRRGCGFSRGGRGYFAGRGRFRGRGRGGRGNQHINMNNVNMQCLPNNLNLNDLSFPDEEWYAFTEEQRNSISALRRLRNQGNINNRDGNGGDDISSLGDTSVPQNNSGRYLYQLVQLPPVPNGGVPITPNCNSGPNDNANGDGSRRSSSSTRSANAGNAFGRDL